MVIILTGPVHSGKTTRVGALVDALKAKGVPLAGYLSRAVIEGGAVAGYDLEAVETGLRTALLRKRAADDPGPGELEAGSFRFEETGLRRARAIIEESGAGALLVVDEVGRAELEGRGVWPALEAVVREPDRRLLLVVRDSLRAELFSRLPGRPVVAGSDDAGLEERLAEEMGR